MNKHVVVGKLLEIGTYTHGLGGYAYDEMIIQTDDGQIKAVIAWFNLNKDVVQKYCMGKRISVEYDDSFWSPKYPKSIDDITILKSQEHA